MLADRCAAILLVKPQFEAGREKVGKGGVVRDPAVHREVIERVAEYVIEAGFTVEGTIESPLLGPAGNREFLLYATRAHQNAHRSIVDNLGC